LDKWRKNRKFDCEIFQSVCGCVYVCLFFLWVERKFLGSKTIYLNETISFLLPFFIYTKLMEYVSLTLSPHLFLKQHYIFASLGNYGCCVVYMPYKQNLAELEDEPTPSIRIDTTLALDAEDDDDDDSSSGESSCSNSSTNNDEKPPTIELSLALGDFQKDDPVISLIEGSDDIGAEKNEISEEENNTLTLPNGKLLTDMISSSSLRGGEQKAEENDDDDDDDDENKQSNKGSTTTQREMLEIITENKTTKKKRSTKNENIVSKLLLPKEEEKKNGKKKKVLIEEIS